MGKNNFPEKFLEINFKIFFFLILIKNFKIHEAQIFSQKNFFFQKIQQKRIFFILLSSSYLHINTKILNKE